LSTENNGTFIANTQTNKDFGASIKSCSNPINLGSQYDKTGIIVLPQKKETT